MTDERLMRDAARTLGRVWPRLEREFADAIVLAPDEWAAFTRRTQHEWPRLFALLLRLYGGHFDLFYHLERLLAACAASWLERAPWLKARDRAREVDPTWFQSQQMLGGVLYVDLFAGDLRGVAGRIPYFQELGLTYLHLMPLFKAPDGNSDGGYAVSSYRDVAPQLGSMDDLRALAEALSEAGISMVVDFVFNHTSDEHAWALAAQRGDPEHTDFYHIYPDRTIPDQYSRTIREIFPTVRRGSFTWREDMQRWVWTTFNSFQWDLNYGNPAVFRAMAEEMLAIANVGIELLRLDAVAFVWKRMGTDCENQPEAHMIIQAYNAICRIAAPALLFKSEAIVHPDEVIRYIGVEECQISYNPLLMALLWEALATREVRLLVRSMRHRFALPPGTAWVNYLRSHDDIGWTFDDMDARHVGIDPYGHRRFLNNFYVDRFDGTFATGVPFQENPDTGDARVSGTLASLVGLERAQRAGDEAAADVAIQRILMLHSVILSIGGIPLIYLGDEIGTTNDYSYAADPAKADDSRWVHRSAMDWARAERRHDITTAEGRIYGELRRLIGLRKAEESFWDGEMAVLESGSPHVFCYVRGHGAASVVCLASFSETPQAVDLRVLDALGGRATDMIAGAARGREGALTLAPYEYLWLVG